MTYEVIAGPTSSVELTPAPPSGDILESSANIATAIGLYSMAAGVVDRMKSPAQELGGYDQFKINDLAVRIFDQEVVENLAAFGYEDASYRADLTSSTRASVEQAGLVDAEAALSLANNHGLVTELRIRKPFKPKLTDSIEGSALKLLTSEADGQSSYFIYVRVLNQRLAPEAFLVRGDYIENFVFPNGLTPEAGDEFVGVLDYTALPEEEKQAIIAFDDLMHYEVVEQVVTAEKAALLQPGKSN